jgi:hypothetical protein
VLFFLCAALLVSAPNKSRKEASWRLKTPSGPVYVFRPGGYKPERGGIVVYVHGLYNDVDSAWREHKLSKQFVESNRNAIFVVPEAPVAANDAVKWRNVDALLEVVERQLPGVLPEVGPLVAMAHSGGYRTIVEWLSSPRLQEVVLVDGLYGGEEEYATWLNASPSHRMMLSILTTSKWADPFVERFREGVTVEHFPKWVWSEEAKAAKLVAIRSQQYDHMGLVTSGKVLPVMLRLTSLARRRDSW